MHLSTWMICLFLLGSGGIFSFAFAPYYQIWLVPLCLSFLFYCLNHKITRKKALGFAFCFGFGFGAVSTGWIANAILLEGPEGLPIVPLAWLGMGILFGLFWGIPSMLSLFYPIGYKRLWGWAALTTLFEWIRSWFLTGFPWNLVGSIWEDSLPILQSASVWGVYGLSFMTLLCCSSFAFLPRKKPLLYSGSILILIALLGGIRLYAATDESVWGVKLRLVQPNIPQTLKWDPKEAESSFLKLRRLSRENNTDITHIIWPESAVPFIINRNDEARLLLMQTVRQGGFLITGGMRATPDRQIANSLFFLDDLANIIATYDKSHLVPFGEYVPLRGIIPWDKVVPFDFDLAPGKGVETIRTSHTPAFGPLVCYEVIFSGQVVNRRRRPEWLVNVTNDGWYGVSAGPYQHLGMAKMRAVEEGLPLVRVANTGISAVFDGYGRTKGSVPLNTEGVLDISLPLALSLTLYARFGIYLPIGVCLIILIFLGIRRK